VLKNYFTKSITIQVLEVLKLTNWSTCLNTQLKKSFKRALCCKKMLSFWIEQMTINHFIILTWLWQSISWLSTWVKLIILWGKHLYSGSQHLPLIEQLPTLTYQLLVWTLIRLLLNMPHLFSQSSSRESSY